MGLRPAELAGSAWAEAVGSLEHDVLTSVAEPWSAVVRSVSAPVSRPRSCPPSRRRARKTRLDLELPPRNRTRLGVLVVLGWPPQRDHGLTLGQIDQLLQRRPARTLEGVFGHIPPLVLQPDFERTSGGALHA